MKRRLVPLLWMLLAAPAQAAEELTLDGMAIIGNRELPKALFIVPWKSPRAAQTPELPVTRMIDEALQPVDPAVFRRKLRYLEPGHTPD